MCEQCIPTCPVQAISTNPVGKCYRHVVMAKETIAEKAFGGPWLSSVLLVIAYATYGRFLHDGRKHLCCGGSLVGDLRIAIAGNHDHAFGCLPGAIILLGFKSDIGLRHHGG